MLSIIRKEHTLTIQELSFEEPSINTIVEQVPNGRIYRVDDPMWKPTSITLPNSAFILEHIKKIRWETFQIICGKWHLENCEILDFNDGNNLVLSVKYGDVVKC